jgi:protein-arginine kinase activator protein McsA
MHVLLTRFYIGCDVCADWLHGSCVNITSEDAEKFEVYVCPRCSTEKKQEFLNKPITGETRKKLLNLIDQLLVKEFSSEWRRIELSFL